MPELPLGAVIAFDFESWDIQDEIALLKSAGVRRVQVYRNYAQGITAAHIRETLDAAGLAIDSLHGYFHLQGFAGPAFDLSSPDAAAREAALGIMRSEAEFARALGCRDIIVHPVDPDATSEAGREEGLLAGARVLASIGARADCRFLIENMPPPMFGRDAALLRRVVDAVASPHVGCAFDSGHATLTGDPVAAVRTMGARLWGVHLHDTLGKEDDHMIPGTGVVPFEDVARALAEIGFGGTFLLEVYRPTAEVRRDMTPARLKFIDRLRRIASGQRIA